MWGSLERIPSWQGQDGRRSLSMGRGWWWSLVLGVSFPSSPCSMFGIFLNLLIFCLWIVANGLAVWHGWLPGLSGISTKDPWAASFGDLASFHLERCLGAYPVDFDDCWTPPEYWDADDIALTNHPNVWTDGSREDFSSVVGFEVAGAGVYLPAPDVAFDSSIWRTAEEYGDARLQLCRCFSACPWGHADLSAC